MINGSLRWGALAVAVVTIAASCGQGEGATVDASSAESSAASGARIAVQRPQVEGLEDIAPYLYDENGCLIVIGAAPVCERNGGEDPVAQGADEASAELFVGYFGPHYATTVPAAAARQQMTVLEETVTTAGSGPWSAHGMVRNDTTAPVSTIAVEATLIDAAGNVMAVVSTEAAVHHVRPGEPAPFALSAAVDAATVASVSWKSTPAGAGDDAKRLVDVRPVSWLLPYGERQPVSHSTLWDEPAGPPFPYVATGSVENTSGGSLSGVQVTAAWLDAEGRVVHVDTVPAIDVTRLAVDPLPEGFPAQFVIVYDDPQLGPALAGTTIAVWGFAA